MAKPSQRGRHPRKRERKHVSHGIVHIKSSFNNTIITITDVRGNVISWASAGSVGFKGSHKSTPVRGADGGRAGRPQSHGARSAQGGGPRQGPRLGTRDGHTLVAGDRRGG